MINNSCPYAKKQSLYEWSASIIAPSKAEAQSINSFGDTPAQSTGTVVVSTTQVYADNASLPMPVLTLVFLFVVFTFIMSAVYVYHWTQFNMGDRFIKNAVMIYFIGLLLFSLPLITFLL